MTSKKPYKAPFGSLDWFEEVEDRATNEVFDRMRKRREDEAKKAKPVPARAPAK